MYVVNEELMSKILSHLRFIAKGSLADQSNTKRMHTPRLKKTFRLFEKIFSSQESCGVKDIISVSAEYESVIAACSADDRAAFLQLLATHAEPMYSLQALYSLSQEHTSNADFLPILQQSLKKSAQLHNRKELSPALLRIDRARSSTQQEVKETEEDIHMQGKGMLWRLMISGDLQIDK